jgi:uncharacterized membrane protein YphA (DoxX/SURF4 family)
MFPQLARFTDFGLLLLRLMAGLVFITSGYHHVKDSDARSRSIETSKGFTTFSGAIQKKIFSWHTGFRERKPAGGITT